MHVKNHQGPKVLIGNNLASHFSEEVVELAIANNVRCLCLPLNATQIAQPLDVAYFAPLKKMEGYFIRLQSINWKSRIAKIFVSRTIKETYG